MKLNLGCSDRHVEGYVNVDLAPPADQIVDLTGPWPWPDSSVDEVLALDICEHIGDLPRGRIHFMNELHRVLKPGARATIETPNAAHGSGYYQDPTHVSPYCLSTFKYFEHGSFARTRLAKSYGITAAFKIISLTERETPGEDPREKAWKITAILEAIK
jgi:predicted SAM-dependent methyltransferase